MDKQTGDFPPHLISLFTFTNPRHGGHSTNQPYPVHGRGSLSLGRPCGVNVAVWTQSCLSPRSPLPTIPDYLVQDPPHGSSWPLWTIPSVDHQTRCFSSISRITMTPRHQLLLSWLRCHGDNENQHFFNNPRTVNKLLQISYFNQMYIIIIITQVILPIVIKTTFSLH